jgi:hypothetical protein
VWVRQYAHSRVITYGLQLSGGEEAGEWGVECGGDWGHAEAGVPGGHGGVPRGHGETARGHGEAQLREETSTPGIALGRAQVRVRFCAQAEM